MNVDVLNAIQGRQSSRLGFDTQRSVAESDLTQILKAAQAAPTFANAQNFELIVVDNPQTLRQICELPGDISSEYVHANLEHVYFGHETPEQLVGLLAQDAPTNGISQGNLLREKILARSCPCLAWN